MIFDNSQIFSYLLCLSLLRLMYENFMWHKEHCVNSFCPNHRVDEMFAEDCAKANRTSQSSEFADDDVAADIFDVPADSADYMFFIQSFININ